MVVDASLLGVDELLVYAECLGVRKENSGYANRAGVLCCVAEFGFGYRTDSGASQGGCMHRPCKEAQALADRVPVVRLSTEERFVGERRVERDSTSDASTSSQRCLTRAENTDINGGKGILFQSQAAHMQPFLTAFTLDH